MIYDQDAIEAFQRGEKVTEDRNISCSRSSNSLEKKRRRKRQRFGDASKIGEFAGPWATFNDEEELNRQYQEAADAMVCFFPFILLPLLSYSHLQTAEQVEEAKKEREVEVSKEIKTDAEEGLVTAKSVYHGIKLRDYLG